MKKYRKIVVVFLGGKTENYENDIFGIKEKAAFRYADRKKTKIYWNPLGALHYRDFRMARPKLGAIKN